MKRFIFTTFIIFVSLICMTTINAFAQLEIHPRLTLEEEYTDNLFLDSSNEQEDWITILEPGISATYTTSSVDASIDYSLRYLFFKENDDRNIDDFEDVQRADANVIFFSGRPFTLTARELITREAVDENDTNVDSNDLINRETVYHLTVTPEYRLQITPSFSLVFGYSYNRLDYVGSGDDYEEHIGNVSLVKELSSNANISLNYSYNAHQAETDDDYDEQVMSVGYDQQVGPRLSFNTRIGYSKIEYDNGIDESNMDWLLGVNYQLTEALGLFGSYDQGFSPSATNGTSESRSAALGLDYEKNQATAKAEIYWEQDEFVLINREDDTIGTRFDITLPLTSVFSTTFDAEFERAEFKPSIQEVDRYTFGASLDFEYRRFVASLGYRFNRNDSDINTNDYENNLFNFRLSAIF